MQKYKNFSKKKSFDFLLKNNKNSSFFLVFHITNMNRDILKLFFFFLDYYNINYLRVKKSNLIKTNILKNGTVICFFSNILVLNNFLKIFDIKNIESFKKNIYIINIISKNKLNINIHDLYLNISYQFFDKSIKMLCESSNIKKEKDFVFLKIMKIYFFIFLYIFNIIRKSINILFFKIKEGCQQ